MGKHENTKNEIDQAVGRVLANKLKAKDNEKLLALRKRLVEEKKHPIRAYLKKLIS